MGSQSARPAPAATNRISPLETGFPSRLPAPSTAAAALTASGGFQVYGRTRSLTAGAKRLAVGQYALTLQLAKLERACEAPLLERLTRDQRPQRPTTLGQTLLDQADQYLGPNPKAPQQLPEPLATVLGAHFGEKKLATFLAATAWPTISVAALKLGIQPGSLQRAIRNLDRVLGERSSPFAARLRRCISHQSEAAC